MDVSATSNTPEGNMENTPSRFGRILKMARLRWSKLCSSLFPYVPPEERWSYSEDFAISLLALESILIYLASYLMYQFPLSLTVLSENSFLSHDVLDRIPPSYEKVYFFNITNAEDFLGGAALNVAEVGPYVYRVWTERKDRVWDDERQTVSFDEVRRYGFHARASNGSLDDDIITWNGPLIIVADSLRKSNCSIRQEFLSSLNLTADSAIVTKKVKELVFGHYHDDIFQKASFTRLNVPYKDGSFSWLNKHRIKHRIFTISTGASDTGIVKGFNGPNKLDFWNGDVCNEIKGTFGKIGPPLHWYRRNYFSIFLPDLCRSITVPRENGGIYPVTRMTFANSSYNPDNYCFETRGSRPSGVYSMSSCSSGAPLWISSPHFFLGDQSYVRNINGLSPNEKDHASYFKVNDFLGLTVEIKLSTQINIEVGEACDALPFDHIPKRIYPVLWSTVHIEEKDVTWIMFIIDAVEDLLIKDPITSISFWISFIFVHVFVIKIILDHRAFLKYMWRRMRIKIRRRYRRYLRRRRIKKAERKKGNPVDSVAEGPPAHGSVALEIKNTEDYNTINRTQLKGI